MAQNIFDAYYGCLKERFGMKWPRHIYAANAHWNTCFWKLGTLCYNEQWDPDQYVKSVLDQLYKNHHYITPVDLLRESVIKRFRIEMSRGQARYDPLGEWEYLSNSLLTHIRDMRSTEIAILLSPMTPFPSWFRLVYPEKLNELIFEWWGESGRKEFLEDKRLRTFVRKVAPKTFAQLESRWGHFGDVEAV